MPDINNENGDQAEILKWLSRTSELDSVNPDLASMLDAAAVLSTFNPDSIQPVRTNAQFDRPEIIGALLDFSIPIGSLQSGERQLEEDVRLAALKRLGTVGQMLKARTANPHQAEDPIQEGIDYLIGYSKMPKLKEMSLEQLLGVDRAARWFRDLVETPTNDELEARINVEQLLAPMRKLAEIGFVNREEYLDKLANYVGVQPNYSVIAKGRRTLQRLYSGTEREQYPLHLYGPGGIGKSALLARFLLDHVGPELSVPIPFAYLDFDRNSLDPRRPETLLKEIIRQLLIEFPSAKTEFGREFEEYRRFINQENTKPTSIDVQDNIRSNLFSLLIQIVRLIQEPENQRPILIILDTLEEAEYQGLSALTVTWDLLTELIRTQNQIRVVTSGRSELHTRLRRIESIELKGLADEDAVSLILSHTDNHPDGPMSRKDAAEIVEIVGTIPLNLRLAVRVVLEEGVAGLRDSIRKPRLFARIKAEQQQGMLFRRILGHVSAHNPELTKLANPGLVLRRITPEIIQFVLAKPCGIQVKNPEHAKELFAELSREIGLVDPYREDGAIWHVQYVRRVMLPDLQSTLGSITNSIHVAAAEYYKNHRTDDIHRAEEIYHRLFLNEDTEIIDALWRPELVTHIRGALEEVPNRAKIWLANKLGIELETEILAEAEYEDWEMQAMLKARTLLRNERMLEALETLRDREKSGKPSTLYDLEAEVLQQLGRLEEARETVRVGLALAEKAGERSIMLPLILHEATLLEKKGDFLASLRVAIRALELSNKMLDNGLSIRAGVTALRQIRKLKPNQTDEPEIGIGDQESIDELQQSLFNDMLTLIENKAVIEQIELSPTLLRETAAELGPFNTELLVKAITLAELSASDWVDLVDYIRKSSIRNEINQSATLPDTDSINSSSGTKYNLSKLITRFPEFFIARLFRSEETAKPDEVGRLSTAQQKQLLELVSSSIEGRTNVIPDELLYAQFIAENKSFTPNVDIVLQEELDHIHSRRKNASKEGSINIRERAGRQEVQAKRYEELMTKKDRPPIGLAYSGGGIRAATFTLGVSQALARYGFLPWVDYLTSVSGGGFTASNLTSLLTRKTSGGAFHFNTQWEKFPYNPQIEAFREPDDLDDSTSFSENRNFRDVSYSPGPNAQLAHLFKKANYLIPRLGLANRDLLRGFGALLPGMGFTFLMFLLAVAAVAGFHYFSAGLVAPALLGDSVLPDDAASRLARIFWGTAAGGGYGPRGVYLDLLISGAFAGLLVYWFVVAQYSFPISRKMRGRTSQKNMAPEPPEAESGVPWSLQLRYALLLILFLASGGLAGYSLWQINGGGLFPDLELAIHPAAVFIVSLAVALWVLDPLLVASLQAGRARAGKVTLGAVFPHPRTLAPIVLLFALQTGLAFVFLWERLSVGGWWLPVAIAAAAGLLLVLFSQVFGKGIIAWQRWIAAGIIFLLIALGAVLAGRTMIAPELTCDGCMPWTFLAAAAVIFAAQGVAVTRHQAAIWGRDGLDRWEHYDRFVLFSILALEIGALLLALALARIKGGEALAENPFWIWGPVVFLAGTLAVFTLIRMVVTGRRETWGSARFRTMVWAVIGMKTYVIFAAALFALLVVPHMFSIADAETPGAAVPLTTAILSGLWAIFLARFSGTETGGEGLITRMLALPAGIRNAVLGLLVVVFWVSLAFLAETILDSILQDPQQALGAGFIALGLLLLVGILLNFNFLSPHYFFGDRVVDVFLRTDYETADGRVVALRDESRYPLQSICQKDSSVPYHLVVTAINLAGSGHLQDRDRKSRHFIFSREFVGSNATGYVRTSVYRGGSTRYGSTIALSGAAASPGLGTFTFFAQSFMMTLFNVRLGQWWLNPKEYAAQRLSDDDLEKLEDYESKAFWPLYLWDEAFARTTARRKLVNLTDGGHTRDNGGIYPLLERRCKIIVAGDASQDEQGLCRDLFSVIHYARLDLGIEVEINIGCLKPAGEGEDGRIPGMSERHIAVGRIHYPAVHRRDGSLKRPAEDGWLIYVKPAVSPAAPAEILQFWETDKVAFPHPTTADQFFSERQFEAQRRLGEESIRLSLLALRAAYRAGDLRDPGGVKRRFLRGVMDRGEVDFALLQRKPGLVDVILRDLMKTVSPLE